MKMLQKAILLVFSIIFFLSSSSLCKNQSEVTWESLKQSTGYEINGTVQTGAIQDKIEEFNKILKSTKGKELSRKGWQLHDELLDSYVALEKLDNQKITIPPKSRVKVDLESYCLNGDQASPQIGEHYKWVKKKTKIPYYKEVIAYARKHPDVSQESIQKLFWNLQNGTYFENYPPELQKILLEIDPKAKKRLPSKSRSHVKKFFRGIIQESVDLPNDVDGVISLLRGTYYDYKDFEERVRNAKPEGDIPTENMPEQIEEASLYADTQTEGYTRQISTIYNPTNKPQTVDLSEYYLESSRKNVQRIGVTPSFRDKVDLLRKLRNVLFDTMLRIGVGFVPVLNDVADMYELLSGRDFINNLPLSLSDRLLSGLGLLAGSGAGYRQAKKLLFAPDDFRTKFLESYKSLANKSLSISDDALEVSSNLDRTVYGVRKSPTLNRILNSEDFSKASFYVRKNGDVIPAEGYRYVPSNAPYIDDLVKNGEIPYNIKKDTYITFSKYDSSSEAIEKIQLPKINDARYRVEFDTLQLVDDLEIPRGRYGKEDYLEPITKDFPEYGKGGATQAVTGRRIEVDRIIDLSTGRAVFIRKK